jgi:hypothetical protein
MSGWLGGNLGIYCGLAVPEAFASTGMNLICAYVAASIPYANAAFTVNFFYGILLSSVGNRTVCWHCVAILIFLPVFQLYIQDSFLFVRHPSVRAFWQWFS